MNRREFIGLAAGAAMASGCVSVAGKGEGGRMLFGCCMGPERAKLLKKHGFDFYEWGVAAALIPDESDAAKWAAQKEKILSAPIPMRSCNGFLPGRFRLTGPKADFAPALDYAERACRRADEVGLKTIVFGSGGARNVPGNFCDPDRKNWPDTQKGAEQFGDFCRQLAVRIADCRVAVVLEPLCPKESNIVNFVWQGLQIVEDVGSPRIQQLADIYHMIMGREDPASIEKAGARLRHCHIASKYTRQFPGANDTQAFLPYFAALKRIGYTGGVSCECGWGGRGELERNLAVAIETLKDLESRA